ncbi:MAG: MmcQ/YjbR family DNA-binding protein [Planctomycetota bacterium]|nr:MAG: MmcQ/YjbR family DNA-binding protein [Planctomycetota bacterium]
MNADEFRKLALALPGAEEGAHHAHPDFRIGGRIFASIAPDGVRGMVKLDPAQQSLCVTAEPDAYVLAAGAWGRGGATMVVLAKARAPSVRRALAAAHAFALVSAQARKAPGKSRSTPPRKRSDR